MKKALLLVVFCVLAACISGCGAMNAYTGAALNAGEADYAGTKSNIQKLDDGAFKAWADAACKIPLGALARNNTGNTNAVQAALEACPIPSVGVVKLGAGTVNIQTVTVPAATAATTTVTK